MFAADLEAHRAQLTQEIRGKSVLVVGGAGSIGSSFVRALLPFEPASLVVVDTNENALTELTRDLRSSGAYVPDDYLTYPMSYADRVFDKMFRARGGFDIVTNFAAHKHVRSEKDIYSIEALLTNNVIAARGLLELLKEYPPQHFFCVSTDKAAGPVNVMGASKKMMEELIMAYRGDFPVATARFANVAFSNGSLPAGFVERIQKHQPISAPNDVTRYFVSPDESGQICLLACVLGRSGEVFFPKLGKEQTTTFSTVATRFLEAHGYRVVPCSSEAEAIERAKTLHSGSKEYPVFFSGSDTSGEKPYEEFYLPGEEVDTDRFASIGVIRPGAVRTHAEIDRAVDRIQALFESENLQKSDVVEALRSFLGTFDHMETGRNLDSKM